MGREIEIQESRRCCRCCTRRVASSVLIVVVVGVLIVVPSACLLMIFEYIVGTQLVLKNGSEAYTSWQSPPVPIHMQYYLFNYTNVDLILSNHTKPSVTQLGPYTYREIRINSVLDYNEYNITYEQNYSYVFEKALSCATCSEDDVVFTPSVVTATLINAIHDAANSSSPLAEVVNVFLTGIKEASLFKNLTVKDVIWGYEDPLLTLVKDIEDILEAIGFQLPVIPTKVPLAQNGTEEAEAIGNITLLTGKKNVKNVQKIIRWRGLDYVPAWLTKYGRMINGSDGSHGPPFVSRDEKFYMFVTDLCRSLYAVYQRDDVVRGIDVFHYHTTPELFANHSVNPDNYAFCTKKRCWGSGILPIAACRGGPPIFMSSPHFYQADPKYIDAIDGMHPNETLHSTTLDLEPNTGISVEAHKRLQINVMVEKSFLNVSAPLLKKYNFLPIAWLHEESVIDADSAQKLRDQVLDTKTVMTYVQYGGIAVGTTMILYAIGMIVISISNRHEHDSYAQFFDDKEPQGPIYQPT